VKKSTDFAQIIGPTICVVTASEYFNLPIWTTNLPNLIYLNGTLLFVAGISIIKNHNYWVRKWIVLITIIGWLCILFGLYRMFFPTNKQASPNLITYLCIALLFLTGLFLTIKGFFSDNKKSSKH